jgi:hypothetical protein
VRLLVLILQLSVLYNGQKISSELGRWISVLRWLIKSNPKHIAGVDPLTTISLWPALNLWNVNSYSPSAWVCACVCLCVFQVSLILSLLVYLFRKIWQKFLYGRRAMFRYQLNINHELQVLCQIAPGCDVSWPAFEGSDVTYDASPVRSYSCCVRKDLLLTVASLGTKDKL